MNRWSSSLVVLGLVSGVLVAACGGDSGEPGQGPDGGGGVDARASGGATGGSAPGTGGKAGASGGAATGGAGTGGVASGGSATGGRSEGGGGGGRAGSDGGPGGGGGQAGAGLPAVQLLGRFDKTDAANPGFGWSGSALVARFSGTGATLRLDGSASQFAVVIDGALSPTLKVVAGTTQYALGGSLAAGTHDVLVWKRTEGSQGQNRFLGLDVKGGQLLAPPAAPERRIEIYGDSISAGYGLDGVGPNCAFSLDTENHYLTYVALSARALNAELHTIAWSGIGMLRNYGSATPSPDAMPAVYARTLPQTATSTWAFDSWQPQVVIINLGTNDASTNGDPGMPYRTAYLDFVRGLRQKYPATTFLLTIGPMLSGTELAAIKDHLQAVIQTRAGEGDSKMFFLEFPAQTGSDGYGCDYHPNATTNAKMATLLTAELKKRLGW